MGNENGEWIMRGMRRNDPDRIKSPEELIELINQIGFLPLFRNEINGFSVEERTFAPDWWSDNENDPWAWREILARSGKVAYGKFFNRKAGFLSLEWLPYFANYRRDGYDFDALWEDGKASHRSKKIMDLFLNNEERFSFDIRRLAGFGKGGEKNFEGVITDLQMQTYLVIRDFRQRRNKFGAPYGWPIAVYTTPEGLCGYNLVSSAYKEKPQRSKERIAARLSESFPKATEKQIEKLIR